MWAPGFEYFSYRFVGGGRGACYCTLSWGAVGVNDPCICCVLNATHISTVPTRVFVVASVGIIVLVIVITATCGVYLFVILFVFSFSTDVKAV